jgi:quercetin dioxygenase-like cupin family protein
VRIERHGDGPVAQASTLQRRLEEEGYRVYAWSDSPGTVYPPHRHDTDQSHWVLSGTLALTVGEEEYVLEAGDRDWLPAGTLHAARVVGREPVAYLIGERWSQ